MYFNYLTNPQVDSYFWYSYFLNQAIFNQKSFQNQNKLHQNIILHSPSPIQQLSSSVNKDNAPQVSKNQKIMSAVQKKDLTQKRIKHDVQKKNERCQKKVKKIEKYSRPSKKNQICQKQGRNSHSNIFRKFFKLLSVEHQIKQKVNAIIKIHQLKITLLKFLSQLKQSSIDHRNYIRVKEVLKFFNTSSEEVSKIVRVLFKNYLNNYYMTHLLSSKKTDSKSSLLHLEGRRSIQSQLGWSQQSTEIQSEGNEEILADRSL